MATSKNRLTVTALIARTMLLSAVESRIKVKMAMM